MKRVLPQAISLALAACLAAAVPDFAADSPATAANAVNALGVDLMHAAGRPDANFVISPYSIETALAMTYAGADGVTREEMAKVLHLPGDYAQWSRSFVALQVSLGDLAQTYGVLEVANRLIGPTGYDMRAPFLSVLKGLYDSPFEAMDFRTDAAGATRAINEWVAAKTRDHIRDVVPSGALGAQTRLVLVNAIYLKMYWAKKFAVGATRPRPFYLATGVAVNVPTMTNKQSIGYARRNGFTVVAIPYLGWDLQFLILLPEKASGLHALEAQLRPDLLAEFAGLPDTDVILFLPKFELEPAPLALGKELQSLGMRSAFNQPAGSANFDGIAPRRGNDYLYLSEVFHKAFLKLDEHGTEAGAATASVAYVGIPHEMPKPIEIKVDRPFLFAIQQRSSGACLFLGRETDPRSSR